MEDRGLYEGQGLRSVRWSQRPKTLTLDCREQRKRKPGSQGLHLPGHWAVRRARALSSERGHRDCQKAVPCSGGGAPRCQSQHTGSLERSLQCLQGCSRLGSTCFAVNCRDCICCCLANNHAINSDCRTLPTALHTICKAKTHNA